MAEIVLLNTRTKGGGSVVVTHFDFGVPESGSLNAWGLAFDAEK